MPRKAVPHDPQAIAHAVAQVKAGRSLREVQAELASLGVAVSHVTIGKWAKDAGAAPPPVATMPPALAERLRARNEAAAQPADPADDGPFDFEASLGAMIEEAQREAVEYRNTNTKASQTAAKRATDLMRVMAQVVKKRPNDPDVFVTSHAEIAAEYQRVEALLAQLCSRPGVRCSACDRELSVLYGRGVVGPNDDEQTTLAKVRAARGVA